MICKMREWEAGESLARSDEHPRTIEAIERNAMQFLKDLHGGDPAIVTIAVQVHVEIMLNPDKQTAGPVHFEIVPHQQPVKE